MGLKTQKLATSLDSFPLANRLFQTLLLKVTHYGMTPTTMILNQSLRPYGKELFLGVLVLKHIPWVKRAQNPYIPYIMLAKLYTGIDLYVSML